MLSLDTEQVTGGKVVVIGDTGRKVAGQLIDTVWQIVFHKIAVQVGNEIPNPSKDGPG